MSDMKIGIKSSIKKIECNEFGDSILIDASDRSVVDRFAAVGKELAEVEAQLQSEYDSLMRQYKDDDSLDATVEQARVMMRYTTRMIEALDRVFGEGTVRKVFRANYELNPEYIPDEESLLDFMNQMITVLEEIYKTRLEMTRKKYGSRYKGKRTK